MKVYVASSWRNLLQPKAVARLRAEGHAVYDFRAPAPYCAKRVSPASPGFSWKEVDADWQKWTPSQYREALGTRPASRGFTSDFAGMAAATAGVLVLPAGASAHVEAGWMAGASIPTCVLVPDGPLEELYDVNATTHPVARRAPWEPELMYKLFDAVCLDIDEVVSWLARRTEVDRVSPR